MKRAVVYFSRTGKSKKAATVMAEKLNISSYEITDNQNWKGIFGFIKGGYYAMKDKPVDISYNAELKDCDQFIVFSPLWAGGPAPAIRTFIREFGANKIILVLTNDGSDIKKAKEATKALFPRLMGFYGITKKLKNEETTLRQIENEIERHRLKGKK